MMLSLTIERRDLSMRLPGCSLRLRLIPVAILVCTSVVGLYLGIFAASGSVHMNDKLQHFLCFLLLGLALYWVIDLHRRVAIQLAASLLFVASILSELLQAFLTTRAFDSVDIIANFGGSAVAIL